MGWTQQMQFRHEYSTDGGCGMAWQPTTVWKDNPSSSEETYIGLVHPSDAGEALIGIVALVVTGLVYLRLSQVEFIAHLPEALRDATLTVTCLGSLAGTVAALEMKIVQGLFKAAAFIGITIVVISAIYHLS